MECGNGLPHLVVFRLKRIGCKYWSEFVMAVASWPGAASIRIYLP
jgi:hypothetical protein